LRGASAVAGVSILGTLPATTVAQAAEIAEIDFRDGAPPVSDGPQGREEVVFHMHGYSESGSSVSSAAQFQSTAADLGYDETVAAVTWDDSGGPGPAEANARDAGGRFAGWLDDFRRENPGTTTRLLGYSMGAIVVMEAIGSIDGAFTVANADMIGSYEQADAPCRGSDVYDAIGNSCVGMYNYWSGNDGIARLGASGGASCSGSETPAPYTDVDVTQSVSSHLEYRRSQGCIRKLLENFEDDGGSGGDDSPTIEAFDVDSDCNWACSFAVSWSVSDSGSDLATVETELYGANGDLLDSDESELSGSDASGTHTLRSGYFEDPDRLVLGVTDEAGNTTTDQIG
jgi:hypothetical protein